MNLVYFGIVIFVIGAVAELPDYLVGAWPTSLTWILMGVGILSIAIGSRRAHGRWRNAPLAVLLMFILGVAGSWLLG